jgi:hypothetical protein
MTALEAWLELHGAQVAGVLDQHREGLCDMVTNRLATAFPSLCFDASRPDAVAFQQHVFKETPRRFHRLIQVVLRFQTMMVIEREYRWGWAIMPRFGVARHHMINHARWYFDTVRGSSLVTRDDMSHLDLLSTNIVHIIEQITAVPPPSVKRPNTPMLAGVQHNNGHVLN